MVKVEVPRRAEAYFDFVVALKGVVGKHLYGDLQQFYTQKESDYIATHAGVKPQTPEEVGALVDDYLPYQFNSGIKRKAQEIMWQGIIDAYTPHQQQISEHLNRAYPDAKASLTLDPHLELPDYLARHEFHIKPGGYYGQGDISAYMSEVGTRLYFRKTSDEFRIQRAMAARVPVGNYSRILDLGCTIGDNALAFKLQFPEAEVYAVDAVGANLKMAYQNAVDRTLEVHFSQQNFEKTNFPDNSFDLVTAYIIFHELPHAALGNTLREVYRILKPGGLFFAGDVTPFRENDTWRSYVAAWEVENNGEPFWREILEQTYMPDEFRAAGFSDVAEFAVAASRLSPKFPWVTMGYKS